jgi:hypothetical protein
VHWHFAYFFVTSANNTVIVAIVTRVRCMSAIVTVIVGLFLNRKRAKKIGTEGAGMEVGVNRRLPMSLAQCIFRKKVVRPSFIKKKLEYYWGYQFYKNDQTGEQASIKRKQQHIDLPTSTRSRPLYKVLSIIT